MEISRQEDAGIAAGTLIGLMVPSTINKSTPYMNRKFVNKLIAANRNCTKEEIDTFERTADEALKLSGTDKHGVTLNKVNQFTPPTKEEIEFFNKIDKLPLSPKEKLQQKILKSPDYAAKMGMNAFFSPKRKSVTYNKNYMPAAVYHEIGHAKNHFQSKIGKTLQRMSMFMQSYGRAGKTASVISFLTILAPSKTEQSMHPMTEDDKKLAAVRKYGPALAALPYMPTLIEEGMASYKGEKLAKQLLSPELLKRARKSNVYGFMTYLLTPAIWGVGTYLGVKAKDVIVKNDENIKKIKNNLANTTDYVL